MSIKSRGRVIGEHRHQMLRINSLKRNPGWEGLFGGQSYGAIKELVEDLHVRDRPPGEGILPVHFPVILNLFDKGLEL